jgi:hypothetical protein
MKPIDLLQQEMDRLIRTRDKSIKALEEGKIDSDLHEQHMRNLTPMIEEYMYIIRVINQYA